jgi:hypothetical protein
VGSQVQFLVDHCDALLATRRRRIDHARSVDFASADGQIYLMKGTRRAKRFADTFEF